ncbi:hypothetical protein [Enterovibrio norvegicus]|uniref:hypothetical protein n=1 Tax=Enterovibrio norvegicus TaxID=188144 RepID=UPI0024B1E844|nr:hypothetical protein [Enterovibrio norvegicus]
MGDIHIPKALQDSIKDDKLILFVGAGLSMSNGLPSWSGIVRDILNDNEEHIDKAQAYKIALDADIMSPLEVLDKLCQHKKIIYKSFEKKLNLPSKESSIHNSLGSLTQRFITTNFDTLIESNTGINNVITYESNYNLSKIDPISDNKCDIHGKV